MLIHLLGVQLFIKSIVIGFVSSIPLGPIGVICIQRTIIKNRWSGFISGLGAATADTLMAIAAGMGLSFVLNFVEGNKMLFKLVGGIIVIIIAIQIFFRNPIQQYRERKFGKNTHVRDYLSTLFLTLSNPIAIFLFIAIFTGINLLNNTNYFFHLIVFSGIFLGASLWWFILTTVVNVYRDKFRIKSLWWLNKISGVLIFLFGLAALISILFS